jgi:hypothetical protein
MIDKYVDSHTIIICGDMNGSLSIERNNSHDAKLKSFMKLDVFVPFTWPQDSHPTSSSWYLEV